MPCHLFLLRIFEVLFCYAKVFAEAYNVNALTMLRNTEEHCIYDLRVGHDITDFIKSVQDGSESLAFIMNRQSFNIFKEECFRLLASKYLSYVKKQCTSGLFKAQSLTCKRKRLTGEPGT